MKKAVSFPLALYLALIIVIPGTGCGQSSADTSKKVTLQDATSWKKVDKATAQKVQDYYQKATQERLDGKLEKAAENYRQALELDPFHQDSRYYLGNVYLDMKYDTAAEWCWKTLLEVNERSARAHLQLGNLYLSSKKLFSVRQAEREYMPALKIVKTQQPLLYLGEIYLIKGQVNDADVAFSAVTGSEYTNKEAYYMSGYIAWKGKDLKTALERFTNAVNYVQPTGGETNMKSLDDSEGYAGTATSSPFYPFIKDLADVKPDNIENAMKDSYTRLAELLADMKSRIP